jgi:hypothetical protein
MSRSKEYNVNALSLVGVCKLGIYWDLIKGLKNNADRIIDYPDASDIRMELRQLVAFVTFLKALLVFIHLNSTVWRLVLRGNMKQSHNHKISSWRLVQRGLHRELNSFPRNLRQKANCSHTNPAEFPRQHRPLGHNKEINRVFRRPQCQ